MSWITPVVTRSEYDVSRINNYGTFNYSDINRINNNIEYLSNIANLKLITRNYSSGDFIYENDLQLILDNINLLVDYWESNYPVEYKNWYDLELPTKIYLRYDVINRIENILQRMYISFTQFAGEFSFTGEIITGDQLGVIHNGI